MHLCVTSANLTDDCRLRMVKLLISLGANPLALNHVRWTHRAHPRRVAPGPTWGPRWCGVWGVGCWVVGVG